MRYLAGDVDPDGRGSDLRTQTEAFTDDVTVELVGVAVFETYLDPTGLPHVDMIIATRPPGDQANEHPHPMREAMRRRDVYIKPTVVRLRLGNQSEIAG
jgi:hypothetical protein